MANDVQDDAILTATIRVLPSKFAMKKDQPLQLEGDVLAEEATWATLSKDKEEIERELQLGKANKEMEVMKFKKTLAGKTFKANLYKGLLMVGQLAKY